MKDFYTIDEVCRLFEMDKAQLKHYAEKYEIQPQGTPQSVSTQAAQFHL